MVSGSSTTTRRVRNSQMTMRLASTPSRMAMARMAKGLAPTGVREAAAGSMMRTSPTVPALVTLSCWAVLSSSV